MTTSENQTEPKIIAQGEGKADPKGNFSAPKYTIYAPGALEVASVRPNTATQIEIAREIGEQIEGVPTEGDLVRAGAPMDIESHRAFDNGDMWTIVEAAYAILFAASADRNAHKDTGRSDRLDEALESIFDVDSLESADAWMRDVYTLAERAMSSALHHSIDLGTRDDQWSLAASLVMTGEVT